MRNERNDLHDFELAMDTRYIWSKHPSSVATRSMWHCDIDVVDHQVVAFEFAGGITGTFNMTSFFDPCSRYLRLHGTLGQLEASMSNNHIRVKRFSDLAETVTVIPMQSGGHGGGDNNIMANFINALRANDPTAVLTSTAQSLETHRIVFAAEQARLEKRVVEVDQLQARPLTP